MKDYPLWTTDKRLEPLGVLKRPTRRNTCACGCEHCTRWHGYALTCGRLKECEAEAARRRER